MEVEGLTFQRFMEICRIEQINLMKVDIEGSEVELLETLPNDILDRIDQMSVGFHDFKPEFDLTGKVRAALNRPIGLGWLPIVFSRRDNSDVLLINQNKIDLSGYNSPTSNRRLATWMAFYALSEGNLSAAKAHLRGRAERAAAGRDLVEAS
jgi:hypothetical protein